VNAIVFAASSESVLVCEILTGYFRRAFRALPIRHFVFVRVFCKAK